MLPILAPQIYWAELSTNKTTRPLIKSKKENRHCNDAPCDVAVIVSDKIRI